MDIKLKNNHKIGIAVILMTILLPALVMVGLYPYFQKQAENVKIGPEYVDYGFINNLVDCSYVLYVKSLEKEEGRVISPTEVYMPEVAKKAAENRTYADQDSNENSSNNYEEEEIYAREVNDYLINTYSGWENSLDWISDELNIQTGRGTLEEAHKAMQEAADVKPSETGGLNLTIHYDSGGTPFYEGLVLPDLINYGEEFKSNLEQILAEDPFSGIYENQYRFRDEWQFHNPRDFTVSYAVSPDSWILQPSELDSNAYYNSGAVMAACVILMGLVGLAALLLPLIASLGIGNERIFRIPAEVVITVAICSIGLASGLVSLVAVSNGGQLCQELVKMNLLPQAAELLDVVFNILCWAMIFAGTYWAVTCLRAVFTMGFWSYWKERTLICRIYGWVKGIAGRLYHSLLEFDLQDKTNRNLLKIVGVNFAVVTIICSLWFYGIGGLFLYSIVLFLILRKYCGDLKQKYQILLKATNEIAEGNLDVSIDRALGVFEPFKGEIKKIQRGFKKAVDEEVRSQRMKTELITNVSHDLKTPLTAIITYVNLMKEEGITEEERESYVNILEQKSMRLKVLIEDLFEISKATSKNVTLNLVAVDIVSLMKQVSLELEDKIQDSNVVFRWDFPDKKVILKLDSQKTYRIFENLLVNITKYAMPHTRAYIRIQEQNGEAVITMMNTSAGELNFNTDEITDRFVRGDISRNTEGSGLGLAIARSFTELQKGRFRIDVEADLFKAEIRWTSKTAID